jgi:hypothetical protein
MHNNRGKYSVSHAHFFTKTGRNKKKLRASMLNLSESKLQV